MKPKNNRREFREKVLNELVHRIWHAYQKIENKAEKLKASRDKVIAHKYDPERFDIIFTYEEFLEIYKFVVQVLDDISIVTTSKANDWPFKKVDLTKEWLLKGLNNSLKVHSQ